MSTTRTFSITPHELVAAGLYESEEAVVGDALAQLLEAKPELRIPLAVYVYAHDERWSVGGAADLAGVTRWEMMEILEQRGVEPRIGPATIEEAEEEIRAARQIRDAYAD
jgi:predicted HTH domain antitoxin